MIIITIILYEQMVYAQPRICPGEWDPQTPMGFWHTTRSPNLGQTTRTYNNNNKKKKRKKKRELSKFCGLCYPGWPLGKIERKWKEG